MQVKLVDLGTLNLRTKSIVSQCHKDLKSQKNNKTVVIFERFLSNGYHIVDYLSKCMNKSPNVFVNIA